MELVFVPQQRSQLGADPRLAACGTAQSLLTAGLWGAPKQTGVVLKPGERASIF